MGQRVSDKVTIAAPADVVMDVITELEAYPEWAEGMQEVEVLERDDQDRPTRARFKVDAKVAQVEYTLAYTHADERLSWSLVEGDVVTQLDGAYLLDERGTGTEVTYQLEVDISIPVPGFMKKRAAKQILDTGLRGLKARAESRA